MGGDDEAIDVVLVLREEGVHVGGVEELGALGLGEDEVGEEEEAEKGVEGDPGEDEVGPVVEEGEAGEHHPVHEPGGELRGVGGAQGFVGGEDGEGYCDDGSIAFSLVSGGFPGGRDVRRGPSTAGKTRGT